MNKGAIREIVNDAIQENKVLSIKYVDKKGTHSTRDIEPTEIKGDKLFGYCLNKGSIRCFIIDSILAVKPTEKIFTSRW